MEYNITYRKKDKGLQVIISYKEGSKWKQKSKQGFEDNRKGKNEAKQWAITTLEDLQKIVKDVNDFVGITYKEFVIEYLEYKKSTISYNTYKSYKRSLEKFDLLNDYKLTEINPLLVRRAYEKAKLNNDINVVIHCYSCLRSMFKCAMDDYDLIIKNPCKPIKEKKRKAERRALTFAEQETLLKKLEANESMYIYISSLIALKCGLRQGEILGLTWSDIDVVKCEINVNKQWKQRYDKTYGFGETKNKSVRKVPISKEVIKELYRYKATIPISMDNRVIGANNICDQCIRAYKRRGFSYISLHNLRHTYATNLIANGIDFKTVAALIGDNVDMVMKVYSHVTDDMLNKARDIINFL